MRLCVLPRPFMRPAWERVPDNFSSKMEDAIVPPPLQLLGVHTESRIFPDPSLLSVPTTPPRGGACSLAPHVRPLTSNPYPNPHARAHARTHALTHALKHAFTRSLAPSLSRSLAPSLPRSLAPSLPRPLSPLLPRTLAPSRPRSLVQSASLRGYCL